MTKTQIRQLKIGGAAVAVALALILFVRFLFSSGTDTSRLIEREWFFDLESKRLFPAARDTLPPIDAPSGATVNGQPAGVKAYVYACGGKCDDNAKRFIAYLETYTPAARATLTTPSPDPNVLYKGQLVADSEELAWVSVASRKGQQIQQAAAQRCGAAEPAKPCYP